MSDHALPAGTAKSLLLIHLGRGRIEPQETKPKFGEHRVTVYPRALEDVLPVEIESLAAFAERHDSTVFFLPVGAQAVSDGVQVDIALIVGRVGRSRAVLVGGSSTVSILDRTVTRAITVDEACHHLDLVPSREETHDFDKDYRLAIYARYRDRVQSEDNLIIHRTGHQLAIHGALFLMYFNKEMEKFPVVSDLIVFCGLTAGTMGLLGISAAIAATHKVVRHYRERLATVDPTGDLRITADKGRYAETSVMPGIVSSSWMHVAGHAAPVVTVLVPLALWTALLAVGKDKLVDIINRNQETALRAQGAAWLLLTFIVLGLLVFFYNKFKKRVPRSMVNKP